MHLSKRRVFIFAHQVSGSACFISDFVLPSGSSDSASFHTKEVTVKASSSDGSFEHILSRNLRRSRKSGAELLFTIVAALLVQTRH